MFRLAPIGGPIGGCLLIVLPEGARAALPGQEGRWQRCLEQSMGLSGTKDQAQIGEGVGPCLGTDLAPLRPEVGEEALARRQRRILTGRVDGAHFRAVVPHRHSKVP